MKTLLMFVAALVLQQTCLYAQELYVFSEPASNMPTKSVSAKLTTRVADVFNSGDAAARVTPEVMFGVSKAIMIHASTSFSDFYSNNIRWESAKTYVKWRFYSDDEVHKHFRLAAFAEGAYSNNPFVYDELSLDGDNSGVQAGLIATQLVKKLAVSATASVINVFPKYPDHMSNASGAKNALSYSLSAGYLLLPGNYTSYKQTNLNLYVEVLGMQGFQQGDHIIDIAPALQVIFNSNTKLNIGARFQASGNMSRIANNNYFIGVERTFLGALGK